MPKNYYEKEELLLDARNAIGKRISELDKYGRLLSSRGKGRIGQIVQETVFGMDLDSVQAADFPLINTELKVTGYKWVNNNTKVSAKERLVITMIDYFEDIKREFKESNLYHKIENILLMLYEYRTDTSESDFEISSVFLMEFEALDDVDKEIIIQDWHFILSKIKAGKAHELSEGDTMYLGACTKGANKSSVVEVNGIQVMKRAYALKTSYMTYIFRDKIFKDYENRKSLIDDLRKLRSKGIEQYINELFLPFLGKTLSQIDETLNIRVERESKNYLRTYVSRMLKLSTTHLEDIEEFNKANISIKTIRINVKGRNRESVSFPAFNFKELAVEDWETSSVRDYFETTKILFVVFDEVNEDRKEYIFRKVMLWNMPISDLDNQVKLVWEKTKQILNSNLMISVKNSQVFNNFPNSKDYLVSHIRPHARDSYDTQELPKTCKIVLESNDKTKSVDYIVNNHSFTKQSFWLKDSYVLKIINSIL